MSLKLKSISSLLETENSLRPVPATSSTSTSISPPVAIDNDDDSSSIEYEPEVGPSYSAKPKEETTVDEAITLEDDFENMKKMGLPTGFRASDSASFHLVTGRQHIKKGEKNSYICRICNVELNSEETMLSHINGVRHMKMEKGLKEEKLRRGNVDEKSIIEAIPIARMAPKKIPIRLCEKLRESVEPVVGLEYIEETIACSNAEVEPKYLCTMCGKTGEANGMYSHVFGGEHRRTFLSKKYPTDKRILDLPSGALNGELIQFKENHRLNLITTIYSDELYPWDAGKAPWSVEQGGTGIIPTAVQDRNSVIHNVEDGQRVQRSRDPLNIMDIKSDLIPNIRTGNELDHCYQLVQAMFGKMSNFHSKNCRSKDRIELDTLQSMVSLSLTTMQNLELSSSSQHSRLYDDPEQSTSNGIKRERGDSVEYSRVKRERDENEEYSRIKRERREDGYSPRDRRSYHAHGRNPERRDSSTARSRHSSYYAHERSRERSEDSTFAGNKRPSGYHGRSRERNDSHNYERSSHRSSYGDVRYK